MCIRDRLNPEVQTVDIDLGQIEKGGVPHFMLKEIFEQPECLRNCMRCLLYTSIEDSIGNISYLSTSRTWIFNHGMQHLCCYDYRFLRLHTLRDVYKRQG